ncbi:hypothetical protein CAPTEDRAFT_214977 [Capitella teleta]|uniref:BING4 C-terminal domain-containing protein n=1 Tax=Capitella teleta TaxID=283909 RepID=R7U6R1_CAPTE|nr:hypothetical protein CAPTEDRAFT_214977 [Capitella teleta]|eukprot:ELT99341.1 hypothetical protein CAPTEDRAFT_214977 [Capitella teleta]
MASKQAARAEALLQEEAGFIEADEGESTCEVTQYDIANAVDITSAQKFFELKLDKFGPYRVDYSRNGRFMLMGGAKGHVAAFDWQTKNLMWSGEPNFDALEANPYQSKKQRQQAEVNMLLEKIQPEMITLDSRDVGKVDVKTLQEQIAEREKIIYLKPEKIEFTPHKRMKGKSKTGNLLRRVEIVKGRQLREEVQSISKQKEKLAKMLQAENTDGAAEVKEEKPFNVFDRFKRKEQA